MIEPSLNLTEEEFQQKMLEAEIELAVLSLKYGLLDNGEIFLNDVEDLELLE